MCNYKQICPQNANAVLISHDRISMAIVELSAKDLIDDNRSLKALIISKCD